MYQTWYIFKTHHNVPTLRVSKGSDDEIFAKCVETSKNNLDLHLELVTQIPWDLIVRMQWDLETSKEYV